MSDGSSRSNPKVLSKYFSDKPSSTGMDESLSEFKETKKSFKGPKETKKQSNPTRQRPKKHIRGQKDIRTALKSKKNELLTYANDFDKVCKQSGIDVDSEQLQIAIALSKSLETENADSETKAISQGRDKTGRIRKTLQEYGFKVPEIKTVTKRRVKRLKKDYKLLLTSVEEKQQIIFDRYSQVLFKNIENITVTEEDKSTKLDLFCIATQITYDLIRNSNFFYIQNLIEQHPNSVGSLLKSWSLIPGRPASPILETSEVKFCDLDCSQDELDIILSGTLNVSQETVHNLSRISTAEKSTVETSVCYKTVEKSFIIDTKMDTEDVILSLEDEEKDEPYGFEPVNDKLIPKNLIDLVSQPIVIKNVPRCSSPDLFDDEISSTIENTEDNLVILSQEVRKNTSKSGKHIMDLTECVAPKSQYLNSVDIEKSLYSSQRSQRDNLTKRKSDDFMEITSCVVTNSQKNDTVNIENGIFSSQQGQGNNVTKRKSNDFMEITNCVAGSSQPVLENIVEDNIDLTQNSDEHSKGNIVKDKEISTEKVAQFMDLTKDSGNTLTKTTIKIIDANKDIENLDLTQSSNSEDELPAVQISGTQINRESSLNDTIILNDNEYEHLNNASKKKILIIEDKSFDLISDGSIEGDTNTFDEPDTSKGFYSAVYEPNDTLSPVIHNESRTEANVSTDEENILVDSDSNTPKEKRLTSTAESFFDEFVYTHSDENLEVQSSGISKETDRETGTNEDSNLFNVVNIKNMSKERTSSDHSTSNKIDCENDARNVNPEKDVINIEETENLDKIITMDREHKVIDDMDLTQSDSEERITSSVNNLNTENDIDLTQSSNTSDRHLISNKSKSLEVSYENLGKINNISIDYDDIFDEVIEQHSLDSKQNSLSSKCSREHDKVDVNETKRLDRSDSMISSCSQNSEVFEISDNEFNYSINQSRQEMPVENFNFGGISVMDELSNARSSKSIRKSEEIHENIHTKEVIPNSDANINININDSFLPIIDVGYSKRIVSPENVNISNIETKDSPYKLPAVSNVIETPSNSKYIIKTDQVTPMLDYEIMTTPERNKELDRYGLKPFKRKRAIQLLTHLYNQTHPKVASCSEDLPSPSKKQKFDTFHEKPQKSHHEFLSQRSAKIISAEKSPRKCLSQNLPQKSPQKNIAYLPNKRKNNQNSDDNFVSINSQNLQKSPRKKTAISPIKTVKSGGISLRSGDDFVWFEHDDLYEVTNEIPVIKCLDCAEDDWVFQKKEKAKVQSCRVPLHIAFHNYVSARPRLKEAILRYDPVNIDDIHKGLVANGLRFDPKDLLKFMDKKCITVKTADDTNKKTN